jgi:hypothetical protein
MKLGLLTAAFPDLTLEQVADWAGANGFETLEIACWPNAAACATFGTCLRSPYGKSSLGPMATEVALATGPPANPVPSPRRQVRLGGPWTRRCGLASGAWRVARRWLGSWRRNGTPATCAACPV